MNVYFDKYRRQAFLLLLMLIFLGGLYFFALNLFFRDNFSLAMIDIMASVISFVLFILVINYKIDACINIIIRFYLALFYAAILLTLQFIESRSITIYTWVFLVPPLSYLLLGSVWGVFFSSVFIFIEGVIFYNSFFQYNSIDSIAQLSDIIFCLLVVWLLTHLYEKAHTDSQAKLLKLAAQDSLTGLLNRNEMTQRYRRCLQQTAAQDMPLNILMIDIDKFKRINDDYGHEVGDKALCAVANVLRTQMQEQENLFRLGGEEFCAYLVGITPEQARIMAERMRAKVEQQCQQIGSDALDITVSIGIAQTSDMQNSLSAVLKLADYALYQAKYAGRNQVVESA